MAPKIERLQNIDNYNNKSSNVQLKNDNNINIPIGKNSSDTQKTGDNYTKTDIYAQKLEMFQKAMGFESLAGVIELGIDRIGPEFGHLSKEEQYNRLLEFFKTTDENITLIASQAAESSEPEEYYDDEKDFFDHKAFAEFSNDDKAKTFALELAKNRFLYENSQKTEEDWNALSNEQKAELIQNERNNLVKNVSADEFCDDAISKTLEDKMILLQAANSRRMSFEQLNRLEPQIDAKGNAIGESKFDIIADYNYSISDSDNPKVQDNLSEKQLKAIEERKNLSKIIVEECKNSGIEDFGDGTIILQPTEIARYLKEIKEKTKKDQLTLQIQYLENRQEKGIPLDDAEKERLEFCKNLQNGLNAVKNIEVKDYGRLEAVRNSEYGKYLENSLSDSDKITVYGEYIERNFSNLKPGEYAKAIGELTSEIMREPDSKILGSLLYAKILKEATPEQKQALARLNNGYSQVNNTVHINEHDANSAVAVAETQEANGLFELSEQRINISDDEHAHATSKIDSASKSENVQRAHSNRAYKVQDAKMQSDMLTNTAENSTLQVRKETAVRLPEAHKDNQVDLSQKFMADKEVATAMNDAQILDKFHKDNQTAIFTSFKNRFEQNDFAKDEAIKQLNTLSNQIQNCDKDNQLAMHNEIMTSKYSEVQENAASNIKNYDSSVQAKAIDAVYQTGNQKAIDKAVSNMSLYKSDDVKSQELGRILGEHSISSEKDLKERFLDGKLTLQEISQLPPSQRREYFVEMYRKATPAQKLQWLSKMPDGTQKKTVYTFIALYDSNLLNSMIENGKGLEMFTVCSDVAAQNKIFALMSKSENNDVKQQCEQIKSDPRNAALFIGKNIEKEPKTAKTLNNFASVPQGFADGLEFFKKHDKFGSFLKA